MTKIASFLQWAALVIALALTAQAAQNPRTAEAATSSGDTRAQAAYSRVTVRGPFPDNPPPHWVPGRGDQGWQWRTDVWLPAKHARVVQCETRTTWTWNSGTYQGAYGFAVSSWDQFKPVAWWPKEAYQASPWQQYQVALAIWRRYGWTGWGCGGA